MARTKITWSKIREPYLYGEQGVLGRRRAEILRVEHGTWSVYQFVDGIQCVIGDPDCLPAPNRYGYNEAKKAAARWLRFQRQEPKTRPVSLR